MDPESVQRFLDEQREAAPEELQQLFLNLEDYWDRKLWHQLTGLLVTLFKNPASSSQRLPLFKRFILSFSEKINQLRFVALGLAAATQCKGRLFSRAKPQDTVAKLSQMIMSVSSSSRTWRKKSISLPLKTLMYMLL